MKNISTSDSITIDNLETLKVVADPLRQQILDLLVRHTLTAKGIAQRLGLASGKLYYHLNLLEDHGLIRVAETRQVANMLEKSYQAAASHLEVDPRLFAFSTPEGQENVQTLVVSTLNSARDDILRTLQARARELEHGGEEKPRRAIITRLASRLPEPRLAEFQQRLEALIHEFEHADTPGNHPVFALTVAFFPTYYFPEEPPQAAP